MTVIQPSFPAMNKALPPETRLARGARPAAAPSGRRRALCLALCATLLGACTPTYNWREVGIADGAARAAFPARVETDTREIRLAGQSLRFSLTSARVGDAVFAVGHAALPAALSGDAGAQRELAAALVRALHENLGATPPVTPPAYGADIEVHAQAGGHPVWALGRVWVQGGLLVEAVATGSEQGLPPEPAREFVHSLRFGTG
jgi:hypothetical protein